LQEKNNHGLVFSDYLSLVKFRLSLAVAFSSATGYLIYRNQPGRDFFLLVPGILLLTCGSAALNQYTEREPDASMKRTMYRPLASKKISPGQAVIITAVLIISGCLFLLMTGFIPFILGCSGVILYNLLYTYLKRITTLAIIPGALVGALPPLIGYSSAGGMVLNDKIIFFAAFMFLWQIPHFWLLLLRYGKEYQDAGFKTIYDHINVKQIKLVTIFWILIWSLLLVFFACSEGIFNKGFTEALIILTAVFNILFLFSLLSGTKNKELRYSFPLLNIFSFLVMLILIMDSLIK